MATYVFERQPRRHIGMEFQVDGFVAHIVAFREIEVIDVWPPSSTGYLNTKFLQTDPLSAKQELPAADSISCLHAIEHFGLGRYGDPIDPEGHKKGLNN